MKKLDLRRKQDEEEIKLEECLSWSGNWAVSANKITDFPFVMEIPRHSDDDYRYFLCQNQNRSQIFIFRNKK